MEKVVTAIEEPQLATWGGGGGGGGGVNFSCMVEGGETNSCNG